MKRDRRQFRIVPEAFIAVALPMGCRSEGILRIMVYLQARLM